MMTEPSALPVDLCRDIDAFERDVVAFTSGALSPADFKPKHVPWGIYEQRRDGAFMVRTRIPGGRLPTSQARAIALLGRDHGGILHLTTRENLQFHDVAIAQIPNLMRALQSDGVACKFGGGNTPRNVVACPYAGVCPHEVFDVSPFVQAVTEHLLKLPASPLLPRKFKAAFSGCPADCALAMVTDIGFIAKARDGKAGFSVYGGGGMGGAPRIADRLVDWIPASDAVRAFEALRRIFDRLGDRTNRARARLRFVAAKLGAEEFAALFKSELESVIRAGIPACPAGVAVNTAPPNQSPPESRRDASGMTVFDQRQPGLVSVLLQPPLGLLGWQTLLGLADLVERFSTESALHLTPRQEVLIRSVREADLPEVSAAVNALNANLNADSAASRIVACTGAATCRLGIVDSRSLARALAEALDQAGILGEILKAFDIRINGCPNCCGWHPVGDIGLSGALQKHDGQTVPSYRIHLGARRGEGQTRFGSMMGVLPADVVPGYVVSVIQDYASNRTKGQSFADYCDSDVFRRSSPSLEVRTVSGSQI
ncbi:MAG: nitrite/sulfite reductase [bacterium]